LGSNGGAVDVRDAGFEVSHCPEGHVNVAGVDARREAVASPVCDCYSLLIGSDTKYREDRAKYLFLRNAHFRLDPNKQGGLEEKALIQPGTCRTLSSKHELGTFGFANFDVMDNFFHCLLVDERSHVDPFVIPVTQLELRSSFGEARYQRVVDFLVQDETARRRTSLARRSECAPQYPFESQVEVGVVHHDHRVLAPHFHRKPLVHTATDGSDLRSGFS